MIRTMLIYLIIFLFSCIPLHLAVRFLGGKTTPLKAVLVSLVGGIVFAVLRTSLAFFGGLLAFAVLLWVYKEMFRLGWLQVFFAWLLQFLLVLFLLALASFLALFRSIPQTPL